VIYVWVACGGFTQCSPLFLLVILKVALFEFEFDYHYYGGLLVD
jgi:hypothetical protein